MYHTIVFQLTEIWCLCVLISFNIAVLVDEMGFDKKSIKVLKSVHTYYQEFILYLQEILLMFYM